MIRFCFRKLSKKQISNFSAFFSPLFIFGFFFACCKNQHWFLPCSVFISVTIIIMTSYVSVHSIQPIIPVWLEHSWANHYVNNVLIVSLVQICLLVALFHSLLLHNFLFPFFLFRSFFSLPLLCLFLFFFISQ